MKILIVEDNEQMRHLIRSVVSDLGTVVESSDGLEAIALYAEHQPDLVLMDIRMKEMDGIEATREIRGVNPDARIIIVTDYDDDNLRSEAECAGACRYLLKENLLAIRQIIGELLE